MEVKLRSPCTGSGLWILRSCSGSTMSKHDSTCSGFLDVGIHDLGIGIGIGIVGDPGCRQHLDVTRGCVPASGTNLTGMSRLSSDRAGGRLSGSLCGCPFLREAPQPWAFPILGREAALIPSRAPIR